MCTLDGKLCSGIAIYGFCTVGKLMKPCSCHFQWREAGGGHMQTMLLQNCPWKGTETTHEYDDDVCADNDD